METGLADGDAEMGAELDDLLASDSDDEQKEEDDDDEADDDDDAAQQQPSQQQPSGTADDAFVEELDEALDEDDEDISLATELPDTAATEAPPVEEGYAVEEGYLPEGPERYMSVYERHSAQDSMYPPPPYGDEGPSSYPQEEHRGPYHEHGGRDGYPGGGPYNDEGGYMPRQAAQPSSSRQERNAADEQRQQRNMQIFKAMTPEQLSRYEAYRRSLCPAPKVKKLMQHIMGANVVIHPQLVLAMRGVAKMYVGEIIECARQVASDMGHKGPLLPCHVQRAYGILESSNRVPRRDGPRSKLRL